MISTNANNGVVTYTGKNVTSAGFHEKCVEMAHFVANVM